MASKVDKRKKKAVGGPIASAKASNGSRPGLIFNSCVNCEIPLDNGTTKVAEFMLSFSESKRTFSVLEALTSVFELSTDLDKDIFPILTTKNLVMCPQCATILASLYKSYVELMQFSKSTANICKLIRKAEAWHVNKGDMVLNSSGSTNQNDDDDDDDEENSESDSDAEYDKKVNSMLSVQLTEAKGQGSGDRNGTKNKGSTPSGKKKTGAQKGRPKKIAKGSNNGEGFDMSYDDDDNDLDYGKKRKRPSKVSADRGRTAQRESQDSAGGVRRRIRRRPSQTREDDYKCFECDRTFKFECRLIKHQQSHTDEKRLPCSMCPKTFIYSWMLENHILGDHQNQEPEECVRCGLTFYRDDIKANHFCTPKEDQKAERDAKPHWCRLCGKGFSKLAHLTLHLRSHEDDKPLKCPKCTLRFKYEKCLQKHMSVHETDFSCTVCSLTFDQKSKLRNHVQTHHTPKEEKVTKKALPVPEGPSSKGAHNCPNCNRAFVRKNDMNRHLKKQICFVKVEKEDHDRAKSTSPYPGGYESGNEDFHKASSDEEEDDMSDGDSMSPGVSNSVDDVSLPSSPPSPQHPPPPPPRNIDLSEESSNSPVPSPKMQVPQEESNIKKEFLELRDTLD